MKRWYVLYTKPNAEYQVVTALRQDDIELFLPEIMIMTKRGTKKKVPLFPNYLFIRVDLENTPLSTLQWTPGLRNPVKFNGRPAFVPPKIIALIRQKLAEIDRNGGFPTHSFKPGDPVRITEGPFEGMVGIFDGSTAPAERVRILLTILGNVNRASISVTALEKISPPDTDEDALDSHSRKHPRRTRGRGRRITKS